MIKLIILVLLALTGAADDVISFRTKNFHELPAGTPEHAFHEGIHGLATGFGLHSDGEFRVTPNGQHLDITTSIPEGCMPEGYTWKKFVQALDAVEDREALFGGDIEPEEALDRLLKAARSQVEDCLEPDELLEEEEL